MSFLFPRRDSSPIVVTEADPDRDAALYRPAGGGPVDRDLPLHTLRRAQNLCIRLSRSNPIANRTIKIYRSFLAGEGFDLTADNPEVRAVIDEFWTAPRSQMERQHRDYAKDALLFGESIHPVNWDELGNVTFGFIDPHTVDAITRNPLNNALLEQIQLRTPGTDPEMLDIVNEQTDMAQPDVGMLTGDTFVWLLDRVAAGTRGTPFLLPALDWLDAYDQVLWEMLERTKGIRAYFWDVAVAGGASQLEEAKRQFGTSPPRTGGVRFHTNDVDVTAVSPQLGTHEDVAGARFQLRHIATGVGVAPHWLSDPEDANRSTAESMDVPVLRGLVDLQSTWAMNMRDVGRLVVDRKVAAGVGLPAVVTRYDSRGRPTGEQVPARDTVRVVVPEITDDRVEAAAGALAEVANAFVQLDLLGAVGATTVRHVVHQLLPALGIPPDELPEDPGPDLDPDDARRDAEALESYRRHAAARFVEAL